MRVLLVEDDEALSEAVCGYLRAKAFVVDAVPSLAQAGAALRAAQKKSAGPRKRCSAVLQE